MLAGVMGLILIVVGIITAILALMSNELNQNAKLKYAIIGSLAVLTIYAIVGSFLSFSNSDQNRPKITDTPASSNLTPNSTSTSEPQIIPITQVVTVTRVVEITPITQVVTVTRVVEIIPTPDVNILQLDGIPARSFVFTGGSDPLYQ